MPIVIVIEQGGTCNYYAHFEGCEEDASAGDCVRSAIGNLVTNHGGKVGITIVRPTETRVLKPEARL